MISSTDKKAAQWPAVRATYTAFVGDVKPQGELARTLETLAVVEAHIRAEEINEVPRIMSTVAEEPRYVLPNMLDPKGPSFQVLCTDEGILDHYRERTESSDILKSLHLNQIATDWYVFYESMAVTRPATRVNGVRTLGDTTIGNSLVFFPAIPSGIIGEMPLGHIDGRTPAAMLIPAKPESRLPLASFRNTETHDSYLAAIQRGDVDGVLRLLSGQPWVATRNYYQAGSPMTAAKGTAEVRAYYEAMRHSVDVLGVAVIHRIVKGWYVFCELAWRLRGKGDILGVPAAAVEFQLRTAAVHPMTEDGKIAAEFGYGTDMKAALLAARR